MKRIFITLLALLGVVAFGQQRNELKIMVLIPEEIIMRPVPDPAAETAIMEALVSQGFRVVDIGQSERLQEREAIKSQLQGDNFSDFLADLRSRFQADILITGEAFSEEDTVINDLFFFQARLEVKAIDLATGQIMFSDAFTGPGNNVTPSVAGKAALQNVGEMAGEALPARLDEWLTGRGKVAARTYVVKVENASGFREYNSVMDNLQVLSQVTSVASRQFDDAGGEIEVVYNGPIEDLAVYLEEWGLSITGLSAGEVRASFSSGVIITPVATPSPVTVVVSQPAPVSQVVTVMPEFYGNDGKVKYSFYGCVRDAQKVDNVYCDFQVLVLSEEDQEVGYIYPYIILDDGNETQMQAYRIASGEWYDTNNWSRTFRSDTPTKISMRFTIPSSYRNIKYLDTGMGQENRVNNIMISSN